MFCIKVGQEQITVGVELGGGDTVATIEGKGPQKLFQEGDYPEIF